MGAFRSCLAVPAYAHGCPFLRFASMRIISRSMGSHRRLRVRAGATRHPAHSFIECIPTAVFPIGAILSQLDLVPTITTLFNFKVYVETIGHSLALRTRSNILSTSFSAYSRLEW